MSQDKVISVPKPIRIAVGYVLLSCQLNIHSKSQAGTTEPHQAARGPRIVVRRKLLFTLLLRKGHKHYVQCEAQVDFKSTWFFVYIYIMKELSPMMRLGSWSTPTLYHSKEIQFETLFDEWTDIREWMDTDLITRVGVCLRFLGSLPMLPDSGWSF